MRLLEDAAASMALTARGYHRVLKLARTLADLDGAETVARIHVAEALAYRALPPEFEWPRRGRANSFRPDCRAKRYPIATIPIRSFGESDSRPRGERMHLADQATAPVTTAGANG